MAEPPGLAAGTWAHSLGAALEGAPFGTKGPLSGSGPQGALSGARNWDWWPTSSRIPKAGCWDRWPTLWAGSPGLPEGRQGRLSGVCSPPGVRRVNLAPRSKARSSEAGDTHYPPAGAERAPGPTLVPIWFPHCPAWMCTISLMAGASALGRWLSRRRRDCDRLRAPGT